MNYYSPGTIYYLHDYFLKIKYTAKILNRFLNHLRVILIYLCHINNQKKRL